MSEAEKLHDKIIRSYLFTLNKDGPTESNLSPEEIDLILLALTKLGDGEIERLKAVVGWVDSWVSNPVGSYSVYALDGLFRTTRDKIAAVPHT